MSTEHTSIYQKQLKTRRKSLQKHIVGSYATSHITIQSCIVQTEQALILCKITPLLMFQVCLSGVNPLEPVYLYKAAVEDRQRFVMFHPWGQDYDQRSIRKMDGQLTLLLLLIGDVSN